jgi:DNA-binding beta-propeller fold protein YncE
MRAIRVAAVQVAVAVILTWAGPAAAADFPKGTFTLKDPDGAVWAVTFDGKDTYSVTRDGKDAVVGKYKATKDEIELKDESGDFADKENVGTYKWKLDGKKLTFTKVKDESAGRAAIIVSAAWEMKEKDKD